MEFPTGTFTLSNENGSFKIRTSREGIGSRAGHDLLIEVTRWEAVTRSEGAPPDVTAEIDPASFEILEGSGGVKPLTDGDRKDIKTDLQKKIIESEKYPRIAFRGREWQLVSEDAMHTKATLTGELELHGQTSPLELEVSLTRVDGSIQVKATGALLQSKWGIKQFTSFLGALKVADPIQIEVDATISGV
jgi:polyisoprenoid-binding protein YceI